MVNAAGLVSLAGTQVNVGTNWLASASDCGRRTLPCPAPAADRNRLRVARRARPMPPQPGGPITVQRRVSCRGSLMVARQKIHAGMIHAGKTATVICEKNYLQVVIGGEAAVVVTRTTTSEIHRDKANASQRSLVGPTRKDGDVIA
jgi:hypothetical protein